MENDKLEGLQVSRAFAALSIAYFHSWVVLERFPKHTAFPIPILSQHGWLAVDLFFAISGYVICLVISRSKFSAPAFLVKRIFRLYPLWLVTLTTFAVLTVIWRGPTERETLGFFFYSATLLPTEQFPYYDIGWSLQHEMVFYLLAAIVVPMFGLFGLAALLGASAVVSHLVPMPWYFASLASYHGEFLAGVLAFLLRDRLSRLGFWVPFALGLVGLWYFVAVWGGRSYVPIALVLLVSAFVNLRGKAWLKPLIAIGDASYSIYLLHPLVFLTGSALVSKIALPVWSEEPIRAACFVLIFVGSFLSWRLFERPMIAMGNVLAARVRSGGPLERGHVEGSAGFASIKNYATNPPSVAREKNLSRER